MTCVTTTVDTSALAERIVNFLLEYDYYHFLNTLEVGETVEDAQIAVEFNLSSGEKTSALFAQFQAFYANEDLPHRQRAEADAILEQLTILIVMQITK